MTRRSHTHGCPKCGTVTVHACFGRDTYDCPGACEFDGDDYRCEDCYEADEREADRIERDAYERRMAVVRAAKAAKAS